MQHRLPHYLLLSAVAIPLFFWNLGGTTLWDLDEGRNCTCAYEMMEAGDWIVPTFNGELRVHKPILEYWLQILAYKIGGVNETTGRLPSALAALITLFVVYELGRRMFSKTTGLLAALAAGTTPMLIGAARFANPDALLNLFNALTMLMFWVTLDRPNIWGFLATGAAAGFAVLAKGPVGIVLPGGIILAFLIWEGRWRVLLDRRVIAATGCFLLIALPWYVMVAIETRANFLTGFLLQHNVGRFLEPMENHRGNILYYPFVILVGTMPWSLFIAGTIWATFWSCVRQPSPRWQAAHDKAADASGRGGVAAYRFLAAWFVLYVGFFSLAATKLPNYILPVLVPATILTARFLDRWRKETLALPTWYVAASAVGLGVIGIVISTGLAIAGGVGELSLMRNRFLPGLLPFVPIGLVFVAAAVVMLWTLRTDRRNAFVRAFVIAAILLLAPAAAIVTAALNDVKPTEGLSRTPAGRTDVDQRIVAFEMNHLPSLNFYLRRDVIHVHSIEAVAKHLAAPGLTHAILPDWAARKLLEDHPGLAGRVSEHADMYRGAKAVLLTNRGDIEGAARP